MAPPNKKIEEIFTLKGGPSLGQDFANHYSIIDIQTVHVNNLHMFTYTSL